MTKKQVASDTAEVYVILKRNGSWMNTPDIRNELSPYAQKNANVQNCLGKLMLKDQAERKQANVHSASGKYVYRYRSGVVVH